MDISSLNAFLHATSKPVQSNAQNCFDRLPQVLNQLIVQCLFPVRQADESPLYRFMRVQILQSRQASSHGLLQVLYQGCGSVDVQADIEWKNGIDHAFLGVQRERARTLFSHFWRAPHYFPYNNGLYFYSPSPAFNQLPFITLLQRVSQTVAREYKQLSSQERFFLAFVLRSDIDQEFQEEISDQEILAEMLERNLPNRLDFIDHRDAILLLGDHALHVHMAERIRHIVEQPIIPDQRPQNVLIPSRKVRLLAGCIAIASVIYSVCRVVYLVFRAM